MATTTTRKTTPKPRATKAEPVTPAQALHSAAGTDAPAAPSGEERVKLRKKEFVDRVVIASGLRKREVKPVVEAALKVLGEAFDKGEQLVLPELGNMRVANTKETGKGRIHTLKLRRSDPADETVAKDDDAG